MDLVVSVCEQSMVLSTGVHGGEQIYLTALPELTLKNIFLF